ncbi:MAG: hypothetical protein E6J20_00485 [Chloroflexi bacterium]|nr:MAG: hypothetical protein E6J20_00485 [Chloroflexota bacterium]
MPADPFTKSVLAKLEALKIREVSGVDAPASLVDGWCVMKARGEGPLADTDLDQRISRMVVKAVADLRADRHAIRHPRSGRYTKKPPDDEVDSAAAASVSSAPKSLFNWRHGGNSLFTNA